MNIQQTCCFTGHRPQNLPWGFDESDPRCLALKVRLKKAIRQVIEYGVTHFTTGMALGVDQWAAELVLELQRMYADRGITLEAVLPCEDQAKKWRWEESQRYLEILKRCDIVLPLQKNYTRDCMNRRNRYMVDHSQFVIAVWDGRPSGTGGTVRYAKSLGKTVIVLAP